MARDNIGRLYCPGTLHNNGGDLQATLIGAEDQIVTNEHAFKDEGGRIRDPLSKCKLTFPAHDGDDAKIEYDLALEDGKKGLEQAEASSLLRIGQHGNLATDYVVNKLRSKVPNVHAYKLSPMPYLHGCDNESVRCQELHTVSVIPNHTKHPVKTGDLAFQTSNLFGVQAASESQSSKLFSNTSGAPGTSGSISFLKDDDGKLIRGSDGELVPIAIISRVGKEHPVRASYEVTARTRRLGLIFFTLISMFTYLAKFLGRRVWVITRSLPFTTSRTVHAPRPSHDGNL